jgi:hypothetical protein
MPVIETMLTEDNFVFEGIPHKLLAVDTVVQSTWNFPAFTFFIFFKHGARRPLAPKKIITFLLHTDLPPPGYL